MGYEVSNEDRELLKATANQIYAKGCNNPSEASLALALGDLVKRVYAPQPKPVEAKKE